MNPESMQTESPNDAQPQNQAGTLVTISACVAGALIPGRGHALLRKWDRAIVFFFCILIMFAFGLQLDGRLFGPELGSLFPTLKFIADAGSGLFYWVALLQGFGVGDPTAYTYDYANVFIYVAGLLNMLIIVDVFDIARGRKE
jgi:hypothetical protein